MKGVQTNMKVVLANLSQQVTVLQPLGWPSAP